MQDQEYLHMFEEEERHWWYVGMRAIVLSLLPPSVLPPTPKLLDVGCGTGYNLAWLRKNYEANVTGIDYSSLGLTFCLRRKEPSLSQADASFLPFCGNIFDLVVSFDVLTQLKNEAARVSALKEFLRVLKPGGRLLLRVAAYEALRSSHDEEIRTYHRYGRRELLEAAINTGFLPLRLTSANSLLFPAVAVWRLLKQAGIAPQGSDVRPNTRGSNWLNRTMLSILKTEASILRRRNLPFGLSIYLLAKKDATNSTNCTN